MIMPALDMDNDFPLPVLLASLCATMLNIKPISGEKNERINPPILKPE